MQEKVAACSDAIESFPTQGYGHLVQQRLFQGVVLHLLLPQAGGQRRALRAGLGTHLSDLLTGPANPKQRVN